MLPLTKLVTIAKTTSNWANTHSGNVEIYFLITKDEQQTCRYGLVAAVSMCIGDLCAGTEESRWWAFFLLSNRSGLADDTPCSRASPIKGPEC